VHATGNQRQRGLTMAGGSGTKAQTPDIFIIAGESSGDELGASLMDAIRTRQPDARFRGVGGPAMSARGLTSLFPMSDIAVMGFVPVVRNLRRLLARISLAADVVIAQPPDALVIIDSPDFTHRVARRLRAKRPDVPVVNYVSPTVWAWRPGRAKKMKPYVDHLLALLPFEPQVHQRLGGPACTYVGHPLIEKLHVLRASPSQDNAPAGNTDAMQLLVLPGSRRSEIQRLMPVFRDAVAILQNSIPGLLCTLPAVPHLVDEITQLTASWKTQPDIVLGDDAKYAAMRSSRAALAASGTVALELALARLPFVLAYKVSVIEAAIARRLIKTRFAGLPSNILGRELNPEFIQENTKPDAIAEALAPLLHDSVERRAQLDGFSEVEKQMVLPPGQTPSMMAAEVVLKYVNRLQ
jgi:lipid-A-disaccharide synthase